MSTTTESRLYALGVGGLLLVLGLAGFFYESSFDKDQTGELLGIIEINGAWNIFHVVIGGLGVLLGLLGHARWFALIAGWLMILLAVYGFWVGAGEEILSAVPADTGLSVLHLVLGILGVACGWRSQSELREAGEFQRSERGF